MKKQISFCILFLLWFLPFGLAQEKGNESDTKSNKGETAKKFFISIYTSTYLDFIISPLTIHYTATGNFDINGNPTFKDIPYQTQELNIVSLGIEPRYNLKEFDENSALSISAPISFGIGNSFSAASDNLIVRGINGFGSLQVPLLLKLTVGNSSTYTTQKDYGFSAGIGAELNKIGLINLTSEPNGFNKAFVLPCFSAGFTFMRNEGPMEINFKYAFGSIKIQEIDGQGRSLLLAQRTTRAQTLKLSWVYLLSY